MNLNEFKYLMPNQEMEFAEEITGDDVFRLKVKLSKDKAETPDAASYVHHEWVELAPDRYTLKVKNVAASPVYVAIEDAND